MVTNGDRKWTHIRKVSTSQDSIFRGEHFVQVFDVFHGFVCSGTLCEKSVILRRKMEIRWKMASKFVSEVGKVST